HEPAAVGRRRAARLGAPRLPRRARRPGRATVRPLRERLRELGAPAAASPPPPLDPGLEPLARLERRMLGESATGLSLRERLERLVHVASARSREKPLRASAMRSGQSPARCTGGLPGDFVAFAPQTP